MDPRLDLVPQFAREHEVDLTEHTIWEREWDPTHGRDTLAYGGKDRYLRWFVSDNRWCRLDWSDTCIIASCHEGYRGLAFRRWNTPARADDDAYRAVPSEAKAWADDACRP
jgi:hypothetical protein